MHLTDRLKEEVTLNIKGKTLNLAGILGETPKTSLETIIKTQILKETYSRIQL